MHLNKNNIKITISLLIAIFSIILAYLIPNNSFKLKLLNQIIGVLFMFSLLFFSIYLNSKSKNSFIRLMNKKDFKQILRISIYSGLTGIMYEFIGQFWFNLWYYPPLKSYPQYTFLLFFSYIIFGIIVRELYLYFENKKIHWLFSLSFTTFTLLISIELINLFTQSWIYYPINIILFIFGWYFLIITFYILPRNINFFS